jgi:hypothetical protein
MALSLGLAVTAAPVKLAEVVDGEAGDLHGAAAVVLQTADHQTLVSLQAPMQCTPSIWLGPMMTLEREAPA